MKNSEDQATPNVLITEHISWRALACIAGMCLTHHDLAQDVVGEDSKTLGEEIASQVAFQAMQAGIDPKAESMDSGATLNFSIPMWAMVFIADIMQALREEARDLAVPLEPSVLAMMQEFRPFAVAAVTVLDDDGEGFQEDLPAFRLN